MGHCSMTMIGVIGNSLQYIVGDMCVSVRCMAEWQ